RKDMRRFAWREPAKGVTGGRAGSSPRHAAFVASRSRRGHRATTRAGAPPDDRHRARLAPPAAYPYNGGVCKTAAPLLPEQPRSWQAGPGSVPWRPIPHVFRRADTARKPPVTGKTLPATRNWMVPGKPVEGISTRVHPWWAGAWPRLTRSESHMLFEDLGLSPALLRALSETGYTTPTPIQAQAIPPALNGEDILGAAQTGTGKTAAFGLPLLQKMAKMTPVKGPRKPRALVLVPTRELAVQVADSLKTYGRHLRLNVTMIFGGVGMQPQIENLRRGVDILVACPGRLIDHLDSGHVKLDAVELDRKST